MKVLIIEDEPGNFNYLRNLLLGIYPDIDIVGPVKKVTDIQPMLTKENFDMIFCDIQLEDGLCFEAFNHIQKDIPTIFTTAYDEYALQAFKAGGIAYLTKPIDKDELKDAISKANYLIEGKSNLQKVADTISNSKNDKVQLLVKTNDGSKYVSTEDIAFIRLEGEKQVIIYTLEKKNYRSFQYSIDAIFKLLPSKGFYRVNRQYIINISQFSAVRNSLMGSKKIIIKSYPEIEIPISKKQFHEFKIFIKS